ncbi:MAG: response regulator [Bacteroidales bacterium]|nr:response regulator [Bacteroidales bacterium]
MIKKWRSYLIHPLTIGFVLSLLVIFLFARYLPRYYTEMIDELALNNNGEVYYFDLDNDGNSEKIHYYHYDRIFQPTLYLYDSQNNFKFLWNFFESPVKNCKVFAGDYNNDSIKEIFVFTEKSDSLFLYVLNSENDKNPIVSREFIASVSTTNSNVQVIPIGLYNLNQKEYKEFLFAVDAGYPDTPGRVFSFDIFNKVLNSSPEITTNISCQVLVEDLNSDGKLEIIVSNQSVDVISNGSESQLIVLNNNLDYLFQPVIFYGGPSQITANTILSDNEKLIAVLHSGTDPENVFNSLMLYNFFGERINEVNIETKSNLVLTSISDSENNIYLFSGNKIVKYTSDLKKSKAFVINKRERAKFVQFEDITGDLKNELIFKDNENLIVVSDNLRYKAKLNLIDTGKVNLTVVRHNKRTNQISIQTGNKWYLYEFYKNEAFFYSHIFHFSIFIIITFLSFLILKLRLKIIKIKKSLFSPTEKDSIYKIEDNIEKKFSGLKTTINEISNELKSESFNKIIEEVDETIEEVKTISMEISNKPLPATDLRNRLSDLITNKKDLLNLSFYLFPENGLDEIEPEIKDVIVEFSDYCIDLIAEYAKNLNVNLQVIQHDYYVNLLIEVENAFIDSSDFERNGKLNSILKRVNRKFEVDNFSGFGTIINSTIPLNLLGSKNYGETEKIKIVIAEDHDVSLFGLISLFKTKDDIEIVGTAKNGMEALKILETKDADIVITDISMPGMDGIELSGKLKNEYPNIKVIVFTMYMENWFVEQLINNGAKGFVSKNSKIIELVEAVRNVYEGNNYYCPQFKSKFGFKGNSNGIAKKLDSLTKNELQIVKQFAENLTKEQIAFKMDLNSNTIDTFVANILLKLNAGDEDEIIRIAKKQKFISE